MITLFSPRISVSTFIFTLNKVKYVLRVSCVNGEIRVCPQFFHTRVSDIFGRIESAFLTEWQKGIFCRAKMEVWAFFIRILHCDKSLVPLPSITGNDAGRKSYGTERYQVFFTKYVSLVIHPRIWYSYQVLLVAFLRED